MKKMAILFTLIFISTGLHAGDPLDSAKLVSFLPKADVDGFSRIVFDAMSPVGRMTSAMVQYIKMPSNQKGKAEIISVSISIMDGLLYRDSIDRQIAPRSKNDEAVTVKGKYKGIRNNKDSGPETKRAMVSWIVGGRFLLSIHADGSNDFLFIQKFIDLVDLSGLEAVSETR
ncbi:MAG: hypothetical protein KA369_21730 [Spirochaetes bacterium]|nr:hypothetical protein [Spirochaetota bacterium]